MMIVPVNRLTTKTMMPRKIIVKVLLLRRPPPSLPLRASDGAAQTALHHPPAPSRQSELQHDEIRAPPPCYPRLLQGLDELLLFSGREICDMLPVCSQHNPDIFIYFLFF